MFYTGQIVVYRPHRGTPEVMKVVKVNPKNTKCENSRGEVWNIPHSLLAEASPSEAARWVEPSAETSLTYGSVVKPIAGSWLHRKAPGHKLFVVVGKRDSYYMLAPLGGDQGIRYSKIPASTIEVVEFSLAGV